MSAPTKSASVLCPSCGARNASMPDNKRCGSCGAGLEGARVSRNPDAPRPARRPDGFSMLWCLISLVVQGVLTAALVVGLPMVLHQLDFEGSNGMIVTIPVWFLGGMLIGMISPGKAFLEPVIGSLLVAIPTVFYLVKSQTVRTMPVFMYVLMACIGVMFTLVGTYIGERIQMGPPPKPAD